VEHLVRFEADFIYSSGVCYHVHSDEIGTYFAALEKITAKPGAVLVFDVTLAEEPTRYRHRSWAWPLEFIKNALSRLEFVEVARPSGNSKYGDAITLTKLKFRRPL
jgi:hypothetical protein